MHVGTITTRKHQSIFAMEWALDKPRVTRVVKGPHAREMPIFSYVARCKSGNVVSLGKIKFDELKMMFIKKRKYME